MQECYVQTYSTLCSTRKYFRVYAYLIQSPVILNFFVVVRQLRAQTARERSEDVPPLQILAKTTSLHTKSAPSGEILQHTKNAIAAKSPIPPEVVIEPKTGKQAHIYVTPLNFLQNQFLQPRNCYWKISMILGMNRIPLRNGYS